MLTLFAAPKPFRGHIGIIQRNAITSWTKLQPRPEIILYGTQECTRREGQLESYTGIDFFVFRRGTYRDVPPLAIGRVWFDQWCIKYARKNGLSVIDLTPFVPIVHQLHDYDHVAGGKPWVYGGPEADENLAFYGEKPHTYTILSATHELTPGGKLRRLFFRQETAGLRRVFWKIFVEK